jgi:hypothetical protein
MLAFDEVLRKNGQQRAGMYQRKGNTAEIDSAVIIAQEVIGMTVDDHPDRAGGAKQPWDYAGEPIQADWPDVGS